VLKILVYAPLYILFFFGFLHESNGAFFFLLFLKLSFCLRAAFLSSVSNKSSNPIHTLHEFGINVPPGYKMTVTPHNLIYLPINCDEISTLSIRIVDQNGDLVNLRGENVSVRMHVV